MPTGIYIRKPFSSEHKNKISKSRKKLIKSGKIIIKSLFKKGHDSGNTGKKFTEEHKRKISESQKGEKCKLWRGGHLNYRVANSCWNKLRKRIYARDKYTCQRCGIRNIKMACHHVVPYRISKDDSDTNLVTVCIKCHAILDFDILRTEKICYGQ